MHIANLYKDQTILMFRECYAMEKIHGTSAHITWSDGRLSFFAGGAKHDDFVALFDADKITAAFAEKGCEKVTVYGEAYGGKINAQSWRYGKPLRFVAFEAQVGDVFLAVPNADGFATSLGLEFVHYTKIPADVAEIDAERDAPSAQARRNGIEGDKPREGVVLRPLVEVRMNNGDRVIAKHKRDEERETKTPRVVGDKLEVLQAAERIAEEWVTATRLQHVLDKLGTCSIERTSEVIAAMVEDVTREGAGEIVDSREARKAVSAATAKLFKAHLKSYLNDAGVTP